ncbi:hypothetical protein I4300191C4_20290 [Solibaculum mannosilyticum]
MYQKKFYPQWKTYLPNRLLPMPKKMLQSQRRNAAPEKKPKKQSQQRRRKLQEAKLMKRRRRKSSQRPARRICLNLLSGDATQKGPHRF